MFTENIDHSFFSGSCLVKKVNFGAPLTSKFIPRPNLFLSERSIMSCPASNALVTICLPTKLLIACMLPDTTLPVSPIGPVNSGLIPVITAIVSSAAFVSTVLLPAKVLAIEVIGGLITYLPTAPIAEPTSPAAILVTAHAGGPTNGNNPPIIAPSAPKRILFLKLTLANSLPDSPSILSLSDNNKGSSNNSLTVL